MYKSDLLGFEDPLFSMEEIRVLLDRTLIRIISFYN